MKSCALVENMLHPLFNQFLIAPLVRFNKLGIALDGGKRGFQLMGYIVVEFLAAVQKL